MLRNALSVGLLMVMLLHMMACTSPSPKNKFRTGYDILRSFNGRSSAKYILKAGQRGFLEIDGKRYAFELLRIDTLSNVTIELLDSGEIVALSSQSRKEVTLDDFDGRAAFELSMVLRAAAIIYVYIHRQESAIQAPDTSGAKHGI